MVYVGEKIVAHMQPKVEQKKGKITAGKVTYYVSEEGSLGKRTFVLTNETNEAILARASTKHLSYSFVLEHEKNRYRIEAEQLHWGPFGWFTTYSSMWFLHEENGRTVGSVNFKTASGDLPEEMSLPVRVFILYVAFYMQDLNAAAAIGSASELVFT